MWHMETKKTILLIKCCQFHIFSLSQQDIVIFSCLHTYFCQIKTFGKYKTKIKPYRKIICKSKKFEKKNTTIGRLTRIPETAETIFSLEIQVFSRNILVQLFLRSPLRDAQVVSAVLMELAYLPSGYVPKMEGL